MDIIKEIDRIRHIINEISISDELNLDSIKKIILPKESILEYDNDLVSLYLESLQNLTNLLVDKFGEVNESELLYKYLLEICSDSGHRKQVYEGIIKINELRKNPFNDFNEVKILIDKVHLLFKKYYHPDNVIDMMDFNSRHIGINVYIYMQELDKIFSDDLILQLSNIKSEFIKKYIVDKLLFYVNPKSGLVGSMKSEYIRKFFNRIKPIAIFDEQLLSEVNERIYSIPFDTHGLINKVDNFKSKIFKKKK